MFICKARGSCLVAGHSAHVQEVLSSNPATAKKKNIPEILLFLKLLGKIKDGAKISTNLVIVCRNNWFKYAFSGH